MVINLIDFLDEGDIKPFGSIKGRMVFSKLLPLIRDVVTPIKISIAGIEATDSSFVRESLGSLAKMLMGKKHFVILNPNDTISSNWVMGVRAKEVTLVTINNFIIDYIGAPLSDSNKELLELVRTHGEVETAAVARLLFISVQNASTRLKRLACDGLLRRTEHISLSGGKMFLYKALI